jgi:Bax protein
MLSVLVLGVGLTVGASALQSFVAAPAYAEPVVLAANDLNILGYRGVDRVMTLAGYTVAQVRDGDVVVPRVFADAMPSDMAAIPSSDERKRVFIKVMLPLVLEANERLLVDRSHLIYLMSMQRIGLDPALADRRWLADMYELYEVAPGDDAELLRRVDMIPPSLALAQAAQESGWGTSRFVHEGNALYGQRVWEGAAGMVPDDRAAGQSHEVRSFDGLTESVLAYMVNLNRHPAYEGFRDLRLSLRRADRPLDPLVLVGGLAGYSEEGRGYVEKIRAIIKANDLTDFDLARLADIQI